MKTSSNGRAVCIAIAGSLAVHFVFAAIIHVHRAVAMPEQTPGTGDIIHLITPPPTPTPKPAVVHPRVQAARTQTHAVALAVHRVHLPTKTDHHAAAVAPSTEPTGVPQGGDATPGPVAAATTGPAVATPTPHPACSAPDVSAKTLVAQVPDEPQDALDAGLTGIVKIEVDLDAQGNVQDTRVHDTSGSMELDQAALEAARHSRYAPEEIDCKDVAGSYLFTVEFR